MLNATYITRYGIKKVYDMKSCVDELFSGSEKDPYLAALDHAGDVVRDCEGFDVVFAVGPPKRVWVSDTEIDGWRQTSTLVAQIIVFEDRERLNRYKIEEPLIFDDRE